MIFPKKFYLRISALFLFLLVVMAVVQTIAARASYERRQIEVDQRVNAGLAAAMAAEIEPFLGSPPDLSRVGETIHYMMVMNPAVEIYLLDANGKILAFYAEPGKKIVADRVSVAPIKRFLSPGAVFPIYGDDPRHPGEKKHFSAAHIDMPEGDSGYLYIVLRSSLYDSAEMGLGERYLLLSLRQGLFVALPIVALLGLVVFFYSTRRLEELNRVVRAFGSDGYKGRALISSGDEIGELAASFNAMADTIAANVEELRNADQKRRQLVASISHDLRNPLSSIRGYTETLLERDGRLEPEARRRYLEIVLRNTDVLGRLVEDLFELSKLEARDARIRKERFSLSELVQDVTLKMQPRAEEAGNTVRADIPDSLHMIAGDVGMIERLLTNLIDNAVRHTPVNGNVTVSLSQQNGVVRVLVADSGPGIPPEDLPHLFERFYIGDESRSRAREGSGLGLAISRRIVELHAGEIGVLMTSSSGSVFFVDLPKGQGEA